MLNYKIALDKNLFCQGDVFLSKYQIVIIRPLYLANFIAYNNVQYIRLKTGWINEV